MCRSHSIKIIGHKGSDISGKALVTKALEVPLGLQLVTSPCLEQEPSLMNIKVLVPEN